MVRKRKSLNELLKKTHKDIQRECEYQETSKYIAERINTLLKFYGVNPKILAQMLRASESSVRRWKNGKNIIRAHRLLTLHLLEEIMKETYGVLRKNTVGEWFNTKNECLGEISPVECIIRNPDGFREVKTLVRRMKYGLPS